MQISQEGNPISLLSNLAIKSASTIAFIVPLRASNTAGYSLQFVATPILVNMIKGNASVSASITRMNDQTRTRRRSFRSLMPGRLSFLTMRRMSAEKFSHSLLGDLTSGVGMVSPSAGVRAGALGVPIAGSLDKDRTLKQQKINMRLMLLRTKESIGNNSVRNISFNVRIFRQSSAATENIGSNAKMKYRPSIAHQNR